MSGFIVISESETGVRIELKVMYNSVGATANMLEKAIVGVMPQAFMEIEKRMGSREDQKAARVGSGEG